MKKLSFLVGRWAGEVSTLRGPGETVVLTQTEEAQFKLGGLILVIEGVGRTKDGKPALQALGVISFDDASGTYRMRAFNDGRFLETEVKLLDSGDGITWSFALGDFRTTSVLRMNDQGAWTELTELTIGSQPPRKLMELAVPKLPSAPEENAVTRPPIVRPAASITPAGGLATTTAKSPRAEAGSWRRRSP